MLNNFRDKAFQIAEKNGFHENVNFGEKLMLTVSELSEALEADRKGEWCRNRMKALPQEDLDSETYKAFIRGTVEEEIADAIIRLFDLAGIYNIDLDWHVNQKMNYNKARPFKHNKSY